MSSTRPAPTDTFRESPALAAMRFILEVIAWVSIYFAWGWLALIIAVALLAIPSTPGDKHMVILPIPGKLRLLIEAGVGIAGVAAAHRVWSIPPVGTLLFFYALLFAASRQRVRWLWQH